MPKINPYRGVNWSGVNHVVSFSHWHIGNQERFDFAYNSGVRHFPASNYYPSSPRYPLSDWFGNVPEDALGCPNAEHHGATNSPLHFCALGSMFASGSPSGESPVGIRDTWQNGFTNALAELMFPDGGGITVNHPHFSKLPFQIVREMLDFDERVLGLEVYNHTGTMYDPSNEWSFEWWHDVLASGRRCWGFFTPDHFIDEIQLGRNVLLMSEYTEHDALKAYREGRFYGALKGNETRFTDIAVDGNSVSCAVDSPCTIRFITERGVQQESHGTQATFNVVDNIFVRIEADDAVRDERLFSQPFMYKTTDDLQRSKAKKLLLLMGQ